MLSTFLACIVAALAAGSTPAVVVDEPLRATLVQMGLDDQEDIRVDTANPYRQPTRAEITQSAEVHRRNGELIRKIVQEHGWPGRSLVGEDGAHAAWLVVQHMDTELDFQRSCLALMEQAFLAGEVSAHDFAYLTDRVRSNEGRRQLYGTQGGGATSAEDEARINANRAAIGLPPWRVAVLKRQKDYANGGDGSAAKAP